MFVRIDEEPDTEIEGYSFLNLDGGEELVIYNGLGMYPTVTIRHVYTPTCEIFIEDIPKLIKALEAVMKLDKEKSI
jgi:hypothetical protein